MTQARATLDNLLGSVGGQIGTPLSLNDDDECILERDDGQEIVISLSKTAEKVILIAPLPPAPEEDREPLYAWLLEQNLADAMTGGATIGLDRSSDLLALRFHLSIDGLDSVQLENVLTNLFGVADELTAAIADFRHEENEEPPGDGYDQTETRAPQNPSDFA